MEESYTEVLKELNNQKEKLNTHEPQTVNSLKNFEKILIIPRSVIYLAKMKRKIGREMHEKRTSSLNSSKSVGIRDNVLYFNP